MILYQKLKNELENNSWFWNYYNVNFDNMLKNDRSARKFIYDYFKGGAKTYALDTWIDSMNENVCMRNIHSVNVFFLGALLQKKIDANIFIKSKGEYDYTFSYIWYLACLAHDMGYAYENYSKVYLEMPERCFGRYHCFRTASRQPRFESREFWYKRHGIDISYLVPAFGDRSKIGFYDRDSMHKESKVIEYNNGTVVRHPRYSSQVRNNYFYYRLCEMGTLDHGIVGADDFFSKLVINYVREYRAVAAKDTFEDNFYEFYNEQDLYFCSEQFKIFAYVADCIASHNIYKAADDENSKALYKKYLLDCLLPENFRRISYEDNPLLFILCVADTIEPSKKFPDYDNVELLNLISIDYSVDGNLLCVEIDKELYNSNKGMEYIRSIEELTEWCKIKVLVRPCKL